MSLTINRQVFAAALRDVLPATLGRTTLPILSNVLLTNNGQELTIVGTNLEYLISITVACNECDLPDLVIEARLLQSWLANQNSEFVSLTAKDDHVLLQAGKSKTKVKVLSADEFPDIITQVGTEITVDPFDFGNALGQTMHGASQAPSETRQYCRGVYVEIRDHMMKFTGLNGIYMIHRELPTSSGEKVNVGIVPQRCIMALVKLLANAEDDAVLTYDAGKALALTFTAKPYNKVYFRTQLIDTKYPPYERTVPNHYDLCLVLSKDEFVRAINNCLLFAADDIYRIYYETDPFGIFLRAQSQERGDHEDYLTGVSVTGELGNTFILNGKNVLDWLRTVNTDNVQIECRNGNTSAVVFRDADAPHMGYAIFPPMILKGE